MSYEEPEHCCSITLVVVGNDFNPDIVTDSLKITPNQVWRRGEQKKIIRPDGTVREFESTHDRSGWKAFMPEELRGKELETPLAYWIEFVRSHQSELQQLHQSGLEVILDMYISTLEAAAFEPATLSLFGDCGITLEITFSP